MQSFWFYFGAILSVVIGFEIAKLDNGWKLWQRIILGFGVGVLISIILN